MDRQGEIEKRGAEITVDTEKGVITNQKLFTPMGMIKTEMDYEKLEVGREKLEVLKQMCRNCGIGFGL